MKKITVNISDYFATVLRNHAPQTGLAAKFSMEFAMASGIIAKRVGLRELTDEFVQRPDVQALMHRVEIVTTTEYDPDLAGGAFTDSVRVELASGRTVDGEPVARATGPCVTPADRGAALRQVRRLPGCRRVRHPGRCVVQAAAGDPVDFGPRTDRAALSRRCGRTSHAR